MNFYVYKHFFLISNLIFTIFVFYLVNYYDTFDKKKKEKKSYMVNCYKGKTKQKNKSSFKKQDLTVIAES